MGPVDKVAERRQQRADLPPGFGSVARANGLTPHPATEPAFTNMTFRVAPEPWYRTNAAKLALVILGLGAAVASLVVLLWPSSTPERAPQDAGSTSAPAPSPSASPTQSAPPSTELSPPPPAPPPPPSASASADQMAPPAAPPRYYPPQYDAPTQKKPQTDVTRAPMSVAPSVTGPQAPSGSAVPGQQRKQHGFFG
ncbi:MULTISPECIES: hypothetical protein [unclassified Mycobacterium]|uniref:hypothetical protein n=1 Tax=unclassified Mycobacterium TaxID=2642494 RepID=UPI0029C85401|nr:MULTISPECIES: hypothetical protein [unclassified Mycobacterium]